MNIFEQTEREQAIDLLHSATAIYTAEPVVEQLLDMLRIPLKTATHSGSKPPSSAIKKRHRFQFDEGQ